MRLISAVVDKILGAVWPPEGLRHPGEIPIIARLGSRKAVGCGHLSVDGFGRCTNCGAWAPDWNPPERTPVKRTSELSIVAAECDDQPSTENPRR